MRHSFPWGWGWGWPCGWGGRWGHYSWDPRGQWGRTLPCIVLCSLRSGGTVLAWVPRVQRTQGMLQSRYLVRLSPTQGALGLQHGLKEPWNGDPMPSHPWFLTEQLCIAICFLSFFLFLFAWAQKFAAWSQLALQPPQFLIRIKPPSPAFIRQILNHSDHQGSSCISIFLF